MPAGVGGKRIEQAPGGAPYTGTGLLAMMIWLLVVISPL